MQDERRYGQDEVAEIMEVAARSRDPQPRERAAADGLTLAELQEIGREVGLAPAKVAEAALALELRRGALPRRTSLGMPVSVGRVVELPRAPTDREWDLLVAELRETFQAQGRDDTRGELRTWRNGNLRASVEPTETGYRFRLVTRKGGAAPINGIGIALFALAMMVALVLLAQGQLEEAALGPILLAVAGMANLGTNALRLPRWAGEREVQMEHVAARARELIRPEPDPAPLPSGG